MNRADLGTKVVRRVNSSASPCRDLEYWSPLDCFDWVIDIDLVDMAHNPTAQFGPSGLRSHDVPYEIRRIRRTQLDHDHFFRAPPHTDGCVSCDAKIAHPIGFAKRTNKSTSASILAQRHWRGV